MSMSGDSNSSPLVLLKDDDSVENKEDFVKLKEDLVLVGDNTDSVTKVASLTEGEGEGATEEELMKLFKFFKDLYEITYDDEIEEEYRFNVFKENLLRPRPIPTQGTYRVNCPGYADLTQNEVESDPTERSMYYIYCSVSVSDFRRWMAEYHGTTD